MIQNGTPKELIVTCINCGKRVQLMYNPAQKQFEAICHCGCYVRVYKDERQRAKTISSKS